MTDLEVIDAVEQKPVKVRLSCGEFFVNPLSARRSTKLTALFKEVQGDPEKFKDLRGVDFYNAIADMFIALDEKIIPALFLFTGDPNVGKLEDINLLDLPAIIEAGAIANKPSELLKSFQKAMGVFKKELDRK